MLETKSWTHKFSEAFKEPKSLYQFLGWELDPAIEKTAERYPLFIPRTLAEKIKAEGPNGVLAKEFLPEAWELSDQGLVDPIGDKEHFVAPQLIHRYTSRALFAPTSICPVNCRYCFRKNELNVKDELFQQDFEETLSYLKNHPEISEIIFTGGDPFTLSNEKIKKYLEAFSQVKSIKDIRFHTRYPMILPERIDDGLIEIITNFSNKFRTLSVAIHANHKNEFDEIVFSAIKKLSITGAQLLSQTVLLRDVNNTVEDLIELMEIFMNLKVRPYYLHHPDQVKGGMHFYLTLEEGRGIYQALRNSLPGWAIPQYVIDIPGGHGKVPAFNPETANYSGTLISRNGEQISIEEPLHLS